MNKKQTSQLLVIFTDWSYAVYTTDTVANWNVKCMYSA